MHSNLHITILLLSLYLLLLECSGYGAMNSIAIGYGETPIICAIQASREQEILCWGTNATFEQSAMIPPLMGLSGGSGFMCGLQTTSHTPFCFRTNFTSNASAQVVNNIVPGRFQGNSYISIAAGENHVCSLRRKLTDPSSSNSPSLDCWQLDLPDHRDVLNKGTPDPLALQSSPVEIVAGNAFSCALDQTGEAVCWGDDTFGISKVPSRRLEDHASKLASISAGAHHVCGIQKASGEAICWGSNLNRQLDSPPGIQFSFLAAGSDHTCGIRRDSHEIQCWGAIASPLRTGIPTKTAFLGLASGGGLSCGIREGNLLADCWGGFRQLTSGGVPEYSPPPELFSPGICSAVESCPAGYFTFNASNHGVPELDGLCAESSRICSPCATECPNGTFLSSSCSEGEDRVCVDCSACETVECEGWCSGRGLGSSPLVMSSGSSDSDHEKRRNILILVAVSSSFVFLVVVLIVLRVRRMVIQSRMNALPENSQVESHGPKESVVAAEVQVFRLADLRDATNGFKEMNEIGRGRYGTVYKAVLPDGTYLAVKRASAARRIQFTNKEFESELEILSRMRHENLVNLVGYCDQMGERLLAYEYMSNGSLFDHLHSENKAHSCPIVNRWGVRIAVASQVAKGIEFLHRNNVVHGSFTSSNVMLDRDWNARVSDFAFLGTERASFESGYGGREENAGRGYGVSDGQEKPRSPQLQDDVYSFGVVMLELLTGRKAVIGGMLDPPVKLVDWAVPLIQRGKFESVVDPRCSSEMFTHSSSKHGAVRFVEIVEICLLNRPSIGEISSSLQELVLQTHHHHPYHIQPNIACMKFN